MLLVDETFTPFVQTGVSVCPVRAPASSLVCTMSDVPGSRGECDSTRVSYPSGLGCRHGTACRCVGYGGVGIGRLMIAKLLSAVGWRPAFPSAFRFFFRVKTRPLVAQPTELLHELKAFVADKLGSHAGAPAPSRHGPQQARERRAGGDHRQRHLRPVLPARCIRWVHGRRG